MQIHTDIDRQCIDALEQREYTGINQELEY